MSIVQQQWPHLYFQGCMAHALNLLLQGWSSVKWANSIVENAQKKVRFIRARHIPLAFFRKHVAIHARGLSLLSLGAIRFATNFLMVARVLDMKEVLKQTITNVEWDTYIRTLSDTQRKPIWTQARELRRLILGNDYEFWQSCAKLLYYHEGCSGSIEEIRRKATTHEQRLHDHESLAPICGCST